MCSTAKNHRSHPMHEWKNLGVKKDAFLRSLGAALGLTLSLQTRCTRMKRRAHFESALRHLREPLLNEFAPRLEVVF